MQLNYEEGYKVTPPSFRNNSQYCLIYILLSLAIDKEFFSSFISFQQHKIRKTKSPDFSRELLFFYHDIN